MEISIREIDANTLQYVNRTDNSYIVKSQLVLNAGSTHGRKGGPEPHPVAAWFAMLSISGGCPVGSPALPADVGNRQSLWPAKPVPITCSRNTVKAVPFGLLSPVLHV